ncbi:MAG: tyrosine-type recombinase/integrase, partial [Gemmatimonadales bacterium]|nr:tyrosine-type recombinase/integrase [Gemmatimonadales bacterium]
SARGARDLAILAILAGGGLRRAELCSLDVGSFAERQIVARGKGDAERIVPLAPGAATAVDAYLGRLGATGELAADEPLVVATRGRRVLVRGQRLSAPQVRQVLSGLARRAAVAVLTPHDLRRTYAGSLLDAGVDLPTVQRLMGHSSPVTTASYDRRELRVLEEAASRLWFPTLE